MISDIYPEYPSVYHITSSQRAEVSLLKGQKKTPLPKELKPEAPFDTKKCVPLFFVTKGASGT